MKKLKQKLFLFFRKHYKIYTWLVLILGILLGLLYEGRGDLGELIFSAGDYTIYIGGFERLWEHTWDWFAGSGESFGLTEIT